MRKYLFTFLLGGVIAQPLLAQSPETLRIRQHHQQNSDIIIGEFVQLLSLPNIASNPIGLQKNADFIMGMMAKRGIQNIQLLPTKTIGAAPAVYGEVKVPGAKQTLIFYAHYDGQPVNPAQWAKGIEPFVPTLLSAALDKNGSKIALPTDGQFNPEWRIYGRGASDDKAGVDAILNGYDA
ncbi:MAG: peptidase M20, partial [Pedobacter sp.]|nr:peptidase M20 [Chitinophagaceae bacterium]